MTLDSLLFKFSHKVKQLIHAHTGHAALIPTPSTSTGSSSGRLPLLKVPTFDGIILHWAQFWEQFTLSIHQCTDLANAEKWFIFSWPLRMDQLRQQSKVSHILGIIMLMQSSH